MDDRAYSEYLLASYRAGISPTVRPSAPHWRAGPENPMDPTRDSPDPYIPLGLVGRLAVEDGMPPGSPQRHHSTQYDQPFAWNQAPPPPGSAHGLPPVVQSIDYPASAASYRLRSLAAPPSAYQPPTPESGSQEQLRLPPLNLSATRGVSSSPSSGSSFELSGGGGHSSPVARHLPHSAGSGQSQFGSQYRLDPSSTSSLPSGIPPPFTLEPEPLWDYVTSSSPRRLRGLSRRQRSQSLRSRSSSDPLREMELGELQLREPTTAPYWSSDFFDHSHPAEAGPSRAPPPSSFRRRSGDSRYDPVRSRTTTPVSSVGRPYPPHRRRGS